MPVIAPLRVPVELCRDDGRTRWFRLSEGISEQGLFFPRPLPPELEGPLTVAFHLPGPALVAGRAPEETPAEPLLRLQGRVVDLRTGDDDGRPNDERRAVRFQAPEEDPRERIARYVEDRLPPGA